MDRLIEVKIGGNHLWKDSNLAGVQGEGNVTSLRISFDEGWGGYAKSITFFDAKGRNPVKRTLTVDLLEDITKSSLVYLCKIPPEPMTEAGRCSFVIEGYVDEQRQRVVETELEVLRARDTNGATEPGEPTPTQAEQLQGEIEKITDDVQVAAQSARAIMGMTVTSEMVDPSMDAGVEKTEDADGNLNLHFSLPRGGEGPQGPEGPAGPQGAQGPQGPKGDTGATGQKGDKGDKGDPGEKGETGARGPQGATGATGPKGDTGAQGPKGDTGSTGPQGLKGDKGDKGDTGEQGPKGDTGAQGPKGDKGDKGDTGATGPQGPQGIQGDVGPTGPQGPKGDTGATGPQGPKGDTGSGFKVLDYYASLSALQNAIRNPGVGDAYGIGTAEPYDIYIYGDTAGWVNNGPLQGAKGDQGEQGPKGDTGDTGPQGPKGDTGATGPQGPQGDKGEKGDKGDTGEQGPAGADGKNGTSVQIRSITETAVDGGNNVVTFSDGKSMTIKNGSKGSDGAAGATGPAGYTPVKGTDYWTPADKAEMVQETVAAIPTPDVSGQIGTHNTATDAHEDIREAVERAASDANDAWFAANDKPDIFVCYLDDTSYEEVEEAYQDGNIVMLQRDYELWPLVYAEEYSQYRFSIVSEGKLKIATVDIFDGWSESEAEVGGGGVPEDHASREKTYGVGSIGYYGHVQLSDAMDSYDGSTSGIAATPLAVKTAYDKAKEALAAAEALLSRARIGEVTLLASAWTGSGSLYSQVVTISGVTEYSQVDLTPSVEQLAVFYEKDITFVTENEDGVVTVYAIGQKPTNDYTIQVTITEVNV